MNTQTNHWSGFKEWKPTESKTEQHIMHEQMDAVLMSLSAISLLAKHSYDYWKLLCMRHEGLEDIREKSEKRCQFVMHKSCELIDEVMQFIGDANNAVDAADDYGLTDAAFAQMRRALGMQGMDES